MTSEKMKSYYRRLDKAEGEQEIAPILKEMNEYIDSLPTNEQSWAKEDFKYYFTKRLVHVEDEIEHIQYAIYKDKQNA